MLTTYFSVARMFIIAGRLDPLDRTGERFSIQHSIPPACVSDDSFATGVTLDVKTSEKLTSCRRLSRCGICGLFVANSISVYISG